MAIHDDDEDDERPSEDISVIALEIFVISLDIGTSELGRNFFFGIRDPFWGRKYNRYMAVAPFICMGALFLVL